MAAYGTKVPSHVLQYATFIKYLLFYLGEGSSVKDHQDGQGWSTCLLRRGWGTRAGWRKGDFGYKNWKRKGADKMARETSSPGGQARQGTGCSQRLSGLCPRRFSRPGSMKPWATWSHLTADPALIWGWNGNFLSSLPTWIILWFICLFFCKTTVFNLKYSKTSKSFCVLSPPPC